MKYKQLRLRKTEDEGIKQYCNTGSVTGNDIGCDVGDIIGNSCSAGEFPVVNCLSGAHNSAGHCHVGGETQVLGHETSCHEGSRPIAII